MIDSLSDSSGAKASRAEEPTQEDFFDVGVWNKMQPQEPEEFHAARGRVNNKEVAHLTYDRQSVKPELKGWNYVTLGSAILESMDIFLKVLPQRFLGRAVATEQCREEQ